MSNLEAHEIVPNTAVQDLVVAQGGSVRSYTSYSGSAEMGWSLFMPSNSTTDIPLLTVAGHLGEELAYVPVALAAMKAGVPIITTGQAKAQKIPAAVQPAHLLHPERLQAQLLCQVLKDIRIKENVERIDGTGHSKGACALINAALRCSEDIFNSVTLWGGAGVSKHSFSSLLLRTPDIGMEAWHERDRLYDNFQPILGEAAKTFASYFAQNSFRIAAETVAVTRSYNKDRLRQLGERTLLGAMVYENDAYFKPEEVARKIAGIVDRFVELEGVGHLAPQTHPGEVIEAQLEIIDALNGRKRLLAA